MVCNMKVMKCKFCDKRFTEINQYVSHLEKYHSDMMPDNMSAYQYFYFLKTGKDHGQCVICKKETSWNDKTNKYHRFCSNPACKQKYVSTFRNRMIGKYGKVTLLNDPEQQKKMLANRSISGTYKWSDHVHSVGYTGTYELSFLEFMDNVMDFDPEDIISPSPHTYYYIYENKKHFYIPDFFIPSLNLEVEIKDGDENTVGANMHPKILAVDRVKEALKDDVMKSNNKNFNYIKIVNKENEKIFKYLELAKKNFADGTEKPIFMP